VSGRVRRLGATALRQKFLCAASGAAVDSAACAVDMAACLPPSSIPLESQMASAEHHGCREIGWRENGCC
jgi:hypothetical protein